MATEIGRVMAPLTMSDAMRIRVELIADIRNAITTLDGELVAIGEDEAPVVDIPSPVYSALATLAADALLESGWVLFPPAPYTEPDQGSVTP